MKLPKFMKNSTHLERQQSLAKSNRQLQLTDGIFRPQKTTMLNTMAIASIKDTIISEPAKDLVFVKPKPVAIAQSTPLNLFNIKPSSNCKSIETRLNASIMANSSVNNGRCSKSQPKRLQRNRAIVSKSSNYTLRSTTKVVAEAPIYQEITSPLTPILPFNKNAKIEKPANYEFDFVDCSNKENSKIEQLVKKFEPVQPLFQKAPQPLKKVENVTPSINRFSFSKLSKFVSQSALKVLNRKSTGSNGSSPDISSSSSSNSSSMITDDEDQTKTGENFYFTCLPTPAPKTIQKPIDIAPKFHQSYNQDIYKSFDQYKDIQNKINKTTINRMRLSNQMREQPTMGITSIIIKQYKKSNNTTTNSSQSIYQYGTTGLGTMLPNAYLVGAPIIIDTEKFKQEEKQDIYDKLDRAHTFEKKTQPSTKKNIKSMSSLANKNLTPAKLSSFKNAKVYSSNKSSKSVSNIKIEQELLYESFNESHF